MSVKSRILLRVLIIFSTFELATTVCLAEDRVNDGLVAIYDFGNSDGAIVRDRAGTDDPLDLKIENVKQVYRESGSLEVRGKTLIVSQQPARRLVTAIKRSQSITIEAWIKPRKKGQAGPARIVSLSKDSSNRNFTLGQDGDRYDVRFRSRKTSSNGLPSLAGSSNLRPKLTHVVYTRDRKGDAELWVDGKLDKRWRVEGNLGNWDDSMRLALGNEVNKSRPWLGTYHLVAIYKRALTGEEIQRNFAAGGGVAAPPVLARQKRDPRELHFELEVAPILANQCLECHDTYSNEGGLDLSRKVAALKGGDSGAAFVGKDTAQSLLWQSVESDEMPHEREPLSSREKLTIKKWIADGAVWSLETVDPAVYVHGGKPDANWLRRLTVPEYVATIRSLFDIDVSAEANEFLPPDVRADGFSNTAYNLNVDLKHIEAYQKLAELVVERVDVPRFAKQFRKNFKFTDKDMGDLISKMGRRILRGPLEEWEVVAFRGISTTIAATDGGSKEEAISLIIEAMLQSPRFIYRMERQRGDGESEPLSEFELATRLSYMVLGGPPDAKLFRAAEDGELYDSESIQSEVDRMLEDPRAVEQSERFFSEWLNLGRLRNMQPNPGKFPDWDPELAGDMQKETLAFFREVIWNQKRSLSDLLNARVTFATPRLAKHYGLPPEAADIGASVGELVRYDLTKTEARGGMLTQGSVLTVGGDEASMVTRGLLVMHELLRGVVKDPPACVDTTPVPTEPGLSQRAIAEERIANATCGGCHGRFEPLAFGLEKFDGLGRFHEKDEHGNVLRDDGEIVFPGAASKVEYRSSRELMDLMANSERVKESITWKLTQFALGRPLTAADAGEVQAIHAKAIKDGGTYKATISAIATSDLVRMIQTDK